MISKFINLFIHLDKYLGLIIQTYGAWTYSILFIVIFCETGLVVTPILPGDSLLFVAGTFAAAGLLKIKPLFGLLLIAAILGDNVNYWIGRFSGPKIFYKDTGFLLNKKYLNDTQNFYEKHGRKTIIIARFMPIVRTFAPFVAGIGKMPYSRFITYSLIANISWVSIFTLGGFYFGNIPLIKNNLTLATIIVILISISPGIIKLIQHKIKNRPS